MIVLVVLRHVLTFYPYFRGLHCVKISTKLTIQLRREMEAIAADKNKLSMEGLLKLEEKMTRVQAGMFYLTLCFADLATSGAWLLYPEIMNAPG